MSDGGPCDNVHIVTKWQQQRWPAAQSVECSVLMHNVSSRVAIKTKRQILILKNYWNK